MEQGLEDKKQIGFQAFKNKLQKFNYKESFKEFLEESS